MPILSIDRQVERAAEPTLERIRADYTKASPAVQPMLEHIEAHLFDPDLDGSSLKRACGVRAHKTLIDFGKEVGLAPYAYIEDCRLEVACRLLSDTGMKVWQVGQAVGYSEIPSFGRAFERIKGVPPSVYRKQKKESPESAVVTVARGLREPRESLEAASALNALVSLIPELRVTWAAARRPTDHGVSVLDLGLLEHCVMSGEVDPVTLAHAIDSLSRLLRHIPATAILARRLHEDATGDVDLVVDLILEFSAEDEGSREASPC